MPARLTALLLGILALAALRARHDLLPHGPSLLDRLWHLSGQYAVLTGLLAAAAFLAVARGWRIGPRPAAALATALALSALITPSLPGPLWPPSDPLVLGRTGLALALPLAGLAWWLAFAPKSLALRDLPALLTFPLVFLVLALLRGLFLKDWPDPALPGPDATTIAAFALLAAALALALLFLSRILHHRA